MAENVAAGIVLFNPDIDRLIAGINAVINQVNYVILCDNGSKNIKEVEEKLPKSDKILIIYGEKNHGIAWALNRIFEKAKAKDVKYVLTLDDDSVCPFNMLESYFDFMEKRPARYGIMCPTVYDDKGGLIEGSGKNELTKRCITSGALTLVKAWQDVSGFDERMFIDGVDFDFCDRLVKDNYVIMRLGNVVLNHQLGNMQTHRILGFTFKNQNHSAFRKYYIVRNKFYLARKEKDKLEVARGFAFVIKFSIIILFFEKDRKRKMKAVLKGVKDGLTMKLK